MERPAEEKPLPEPASDRWEKWMDLMELNWYNAMEAARGDYMGIRNALQAKALNGNASTAEGKETRHRHA